MSIQETRIDEIIDDVRSGITDSDLIEKYHISAKSLKYLLNQLLNQGRMSGAALYWRPLMCDDSVETESRRLLPRYLVASLIPAHYEENPEAKGWVFDINERGVRICGLTAKPGEVKRLVFLVRQMKEMRNIVAEAECRWFAMEGPEARPFAGFKIISITPENLLALRELIRQITGCQFR
ncbi:MAG: hypothetical protein HY912_09205 [Desulfomonile tiedjei]|uniref:PilZ domain-containing protein n=1 Tax=Desulfomonile tiedjei TaxID=2358 RepID=A0A9D6Z3A0_9BACT|nr:hypothetical protein [Desulfomonile tiedjei]